jgi:IclR family acetate operon transcriptional repressor
MTTPSSRTAAKGRVSQKIHVELDAAAEEDLKGSQTVAAIERAADTLLYFVQSDRADSGVTEIARDLGLSKAAVHRILASLRSRNLVSLDETTRRYTLGPTALMLGLTYLDRIDIRRLAAVQLPALSEATQETATLSVRTGTSRFYIEQVPPAREVIMSVKLGFPYPLHAGSSSKAFLAFLPEPEIDAYLSGPLAKVTDSTIVDKRALRRDLESIRERGWADSTGERQAGAASIAAPVLDHRGLPQAAISVCGPADRFLASKDRSVELLLNTTRALSARLGHNAESA